MEASAHPEAIEQILDAMKTIFSKNFPESKIQDILEKIKAEIGSSDVKAQVSLKQQLRNVLMDAENLVTELSHDASGASFCRVNSFRTREKKKVMVDLKSVAFMNSERKELVCESEKALEVVVVGRENEKEEIIDQLIYFSSGGSHVPVITIVGLAGIGKTKLAHLVCGDENVKQKIGVPAPIICTNYNTFDAIAKIIYGTCVAMARNIAARVENPKIILILDDLRVEIGDKDLEELQHKLKMAGLCVAAIMITTRSCLVAMARNIASSPVKSYDLAGLNEEESMCLFQTILGRRAVDDSSITEDLRRKIVGQCRGVPVAIEIMAKLLYSRPSRLTELMEDFLQELTYFYYNERLPNELCFAYCSVFPEDYLIDAERLIHLWMAEGFLKHSTSDPSTSSASLDPEEIGRRYLRNLVGKSIFQDVKEDEFGVVRSCRMHPLMHDIARFLNDRVNITVDSNGYKVHENVMRASLDLSLNLLSRSPAPLFDKAEQLRSVFLFTKTQQRLRLRQVNMTKLGKLGIIKRFKKLRVLDLRNLRIKTVPSSIGELNNLEYLDLSLNDIEKLPSSIIKLSKLETLKLSCCQSLKKLPKNFENLAKLKHLDLEGCLSLTRMPRKMSKLSSLQTLSAFVVSKKYPTRGLEELAKLNKLRGHLEILYLNRVQYFPKNVETKYLDKKQHLQRLTLRWDLGVDQKEVAHQYHLSVLDSLRPHSDLGVLILVGYQGSSLSNWLTSIQLKFLVKLSLYECHGCKFLVPQQYQLPKLKILELQWLDNLEYIAENCDKEAAFYSTLEELTIEDCPKLKSWWKEEIEGNSWPFFARVSKLHVIHCPLLTCKPLYPRHHKEPVLEVGSSCSGKELVLEGSSLKLLLDTIVSSSVDYSIPLENLHIQNCNDLENLSDAFQRLSSLQRLTIENCAGINLDGKSNQWEGLKSLRFLTIRKIPILSSLSFGDSVTTLREVTLYNCHGLTSISDNIGKVTSLRRLSISRCNKLESLPKAMKDLTSLKTLIVLDCALLLPRCQSETGEDWPQIRHVKYIQVK